ncbi:hypothetical protein LSAT2_006877, partial [Lamellibrachia satsuma]
MTDEEQPATVLFLPNELSTTPAGTHLQATDAGRLSMSSFLHWASDSVNDEPIADEDANRLLREALVDDTSSSNVKSMLVRLPKYSPCELLRPSLAERLAVVESQLRQLSDSVSTNKEIRLRMEGDLTTLTKKSASIPSQSYAETLKTATGGQEKKLAVKLPPTSTDHSRKHRMRKVDYGTVKRMSQGSLTRLLKQASNQQDISLTMLPRKKAAMPTR